MASETILKSIANAITQKPPFCTGSFPATSEETTLFYKQGSTSSWLDLTQATEADLETLAQACAPATFGRDKQDVLDESYRKAGKMDFGDFSMMLNIEKLGIVSRIHQQLLDGADNKKVIKAEPYKLNIYGKGSFFKSHKDTPRGDNMFGSLVLVFPTPHVGGALVLRHFGQEWTFDSSALTREQAMPSVAYIAFYSDVEHEVTLVESGHRVTLTYNLFFEEKRSLSIPPVAPGDNILRDALSAALNDPTFLPEGGHLGFGLSFKYPFSSSLPVELSFATSLGAVYDIDDMEVLVSITNLMSQHWNYERPIARAIYETNNGRVIHEFGKDLPYHEYGYNPKPKETIRLAWVTPLTTYSNFSSPYVAYGNEAVADCAYADLCITVEVGPFGARTTLGQEDNQKNAVN